MSHFTRVKTEITDLGCLLEALADMGFDEVETGTNLGLYGYEGRLREERADVVIRRKFVGSASNDIGFHLEPDGTYQAIVSEYDGRIRPKFLQEVTQRYAYHVVTRGAEAQGFTIDSEEVQQDGSIKLICTQW